MNETPLPTPRTDSWVFLPSGRPITQNDEAVPAKFARQLERELSAAKELLREIRDGEVNPECEADKFLRDHRPSELSTARARIAELEGSLSRCHPANTWDKARMYYTDGAVTADHPLIAWHRANCEAADKALAAKGGAPTLSKPIT